MKLYCRTVKTGGGKCLRVSYHAEFGRVQTPYRADSLSVANRQYLIRPRYYLNDHNLPKSLDKIGLKKEDIEQFRRNNLVFP